VSLDVSPTTMPSPRDIHKAVERTSFVRLPGGIVGKSAYVLISVAAALGTMVFATKSEVVAYVAIAALVITVIPTLWRLINFAERHPDVSLMEGGELLDLHRLRFAQKDVGE